MKIYYGPAHPAFKEPFGLELEIDGEIVEDVNIKLGYVHRNVEKVLESSNWINGMVIASKICGICSSVHVNTYCSAVEKVFGIEIPERAKYIRTIVLELERIASHLLWFGTFMHELGYDTLFMMAWNDREKILEFMEKVSGRRVGWMVSIPGGVRRDIRGGAIEELRKILEYIKRRVEFYKKEVEKDTTILMRTKKVGILKRSIVEDYGVVGPIARASGVKRDIRYQDKYLLYDEAPYEIVIREEGDCFARMMVRLEEIEKSIEIVKWCLNNIKGNDILKRIHPFQRPEEGEAISRMEAPRGELFYYVRSGGGLNPERVRIRTPTFANLPILKFLLKGCYLADVPAITFSFDPCISCMEKFIIIEKDKKRIMTRKELLEYSKRWFEENKKEIMRERL